MSKRKVFEATKGDKVVKVFRLPETDEYQVRLYVNGELHAPADYFTGDKLDALWTAGTMLEGVRI